MDWWMPTVRVLLGLGLLIGAAAGPDSASATARMYWADQGASKIQRADLDGTAVEDLVAAGLSLPTGVALDVAGGKMYWTDGGTQKIQRANLDGTAVADLVTTGLSFPAGVALDVAGGKMYWTDANLQKIQRANLDGTAVADLVTGLGAPIGIALDVAGGKMYWTDESSQKIQRANLDGTAVADLVTTGLGFPAGIALDVAGGKMYWTDNGTQKIQRANLDGTGAEDLVATGLDSPRLIALELEAVQQLSALGPAALWVGLRNSDDGNTAFDLQVELRRDGALVASGLTRCIRGLVRSPASAREVEVAFDSFTAVETSPGDVLALTVLTRIGTNANDTRCTGRGASHRSATGLRLYYDAVSRASRFEATIEPSASGSLFLHSEASACPLGPAGSGGGPAGFLDDTAPTASTATCKDSQGVDFAGGNPWKAIGVWSVTLP